MAITLLVAVIASVSGALVTNAFATSHNPTFTTPQNLALFGAVLGAAIPPFIAVAGRFAGVGAGLVISVIALGVTYGGFTVHDIGQPPEKRIMPLPVTTTLPGYQCEGGGTLCISWSPSKLSCSKDPCEQEVTVTNAGTAVLKVTGLPFIGDAAGRLSAEGTCAPPKPPKSLQKNESCDIKVRVKPGESGKAQLKIQQNLQTVGASLVDVDVDAWSDPTNKPDLQLESQGKCSVTPGAPGGNDTLAVSVGVRNMGPGELTRQVPFKIAVDNGLWATGYADVSSDQATVMIVGLKLGDYKQKTAFCCRDS
jgi:hypothetical protein